MNFLEMTGNEKTANYKWNRGCSGSYHHWEMFVLDGNAVLHVEGLDEQYWGHIQLENVYDPDMESIYSTKDSHVELFKTPEECAKILELKWRDITFEDSKLTFSEQLNWC